MSPDCSLRELEDDDRSRGEIQEWRDEGVQRRGRRRPNLHHLEKLLFLRENLNKKSIVIDY